MEVLLILPSGKHTKSYGKLPIEIVIVPLNMVIFHSYVSLPEGISTTGFNGKGILVLGKSGHVKAFTLWEIYKTCLAGVPNTVTKKTNHHHNWLVVWNIVYFSICRE